MRLVAVLSVLAGIACSDTPMRRPPGSGDLPYPRIASYLMTPTIDDAARTMLERVPLAIADAARGSSDLEALAAVRDRNRSLQLLARVATTAIRHAPAPDAKLAAVPAAAWVLEPGSTTVGGVSASDTRIRVASPAAFTLTRPISPLHGAAEPTHLLLGDEHVELVAIEGDELVVERGIHSAAVTHPAGSPIAAHHVLGAGTWLVDAGAAAWRDLVIADVAALVASGTWSGVFLDDCIDDIATAAGGALDLDRDGVADEPAVAGAAWLAGFGVLADELRAQLGADVPLVARAVMRDCPYDALDGVLLDGFPIGPAFGTESFQAGFDRYLDWTSRSGRDPLTIASAYSPLIGAGSILPADEEQARTDYVAMRFGLATALMADGYYAFDNGPFGHTTAWWYEEYDGAGLGDGWLGHPQGPPTRVSGGAYIRMFTRGMVIANPTATPLVVTVPPGHRTLAGTQDPAHDDGSPVEGALVVGASDAYLLAR
jgi:hypothetical protein